ncbi:MAG TPA: hypothetical protein ENI58_03350 [Nitrospirae bacterium]|nr:hypothetical protein [Nitrospirota bacterium]
MEYRFAVVFRFPEPFEEGSVEVNDTDPRKAGKPPFRPVPANHQSDSRVARISEKLVERARELLKDESDSKSLGYIKGMKIES